MHYHLKIQANTDSPTHISFMNLASLMLPQCIYYATLHHSDVMMKSPACQLFLLNRLFRRRSKKTSKLCVTGLCEGNSPVTGEFPAQRASDAEIFLFDDVITQRVWCGHSVYITQHLGNRSMTKTSKYPSNRGRFTKKTCHLTSKRTLKY